MLRKIQPSVEEYHHPAMEKESHCDLLLEQRRTRKSLQQDEKKNKAKEPESRYRLNLNTEQ